MRMSGLSLSEFISGVATGPFTFISSMPVAPARKRFWTTATDSVPHMRAWTYALDFKPGIDVMPTIDYLESLKAQEVAEWRINEHE